MAPQSLRERYKESLEQKRRIARAIGRLIAQLERGSLSEEAIPAYLEALEQLRELNNALLDIPPGELHEYLKRHVQNPAAIRRLEGIIYGHPDPQYGLPQGSSIIGYLKKERELIEEALHGLKSRALPMHIAGRLRELRGLLRQRLRLLRTLVRDLERMHKQPLQVKILGIGEITTTITLAGDPSRGRAHPRTREWITLAYKRMPSFPSFAEADKYVKLYHEYHELLERIGVAVPPWRAYLTSREDGVHIVYSAQQCLPKETIAANILPQVSKEECVLLFRGIMERLLKVFEFNRMSEGIKIGFDGQIPNWSVRGYDPRSPRLTGQEELLYLDTSTPLIRKNGVEQLNTEVFIKSVPSVLRPIFRRTMVKEVLDRYYDPQEVILDLIASYILYRRPEVVGELCRAANEFVAERMSDYGLAVYDARQVVRYHRFDTMIWVVFRFLKRMDRRITEGLLHKPYEQRLPRHKFVPGPYVEKEGEDD